jgi:hypothetical protein
MISSQPGRPGAEEEGVGDEREYECRRCSRLLRVSICETSFVRRGSRSDMVRWGREEERRRVERAPFKLDGSFRSKTRGGRHCDHLAIVRQAKTEEQSQESSVADNSIRRSSSPRDPSLLVPLTRNTCNLSRCNHSYPILRCGLPQSPPPPPLLPRNSLLPPPTPLLTLPRGSHLDLPLLFRCLRLTPRTPS